MKVFEALGEGKGTFTEYQLPELKPEQVLVRIVYCGICGTDYALYLGNSSFVREGRVTYPLRLGHEWSGVVERVGEAVVHFAPGDRVVGDNAVTCGECEACRNQRYGQCNNIRSVGTIDPFWPGAFAEYFVIPWWHLYHVEDNVSLLDAALCEPLSVAYGGIRKMEIKEDSIVVVIGTGCIGLAAAILAKAKGAHKVYMVGRNPYKLNIALQAGLNGIINLRESDPVQALLEMTDGRLADFVLECSGAVTSFNVALRLAKRKAKVALIAFYENELPPPAITDLVSKELHVFGVMGEYGNAQASLEIMAKENLQINKCITSIVEYEKLPENLQNADMSKVIKTIVRISQE